MNEDKIQLQGSWKKVSDYQEYCLILDIKIIINDAHVIWNHVDIYSLALYSMDHKSKTYGNAWWSNFKPFSCSCGVAGCAGISDGIYVKERKHSIEWRAKKEDGYDFLGKSFFSFDKSQYIKAFNDFFWWLRNEVDYDYKLCVDLGFYKGGETSVEDFFKWWDECKQ